MAQHPYTLTTGVPQLDTVLGGGIVRDSMVLIVGPSGGGKTILASQIAFTAARQDAPVLIVTAFSEPHNKLISNLERFDFFERGFIGERIRLINVQHQLVNSLEEAAATIVREAREHNAGVVLFDGFYGVHVCSGAPNAAYHFLHDLGAKLNLLGVTTIVMCEHDIDHPPLAEYMLADTVIALDRYTTSNRVVRNLQIVKHRGMQPMLGQHSLVLNTTGVHCYPRQEALPRPADRAVSSDRLSIGIAHVDRLLDGGLVRGSSTLIAGATGTGKTTFGLHYALQGVRDGEPALLISFGETAQQLIARAAALDPVAATRLDIRHYALAELDPDIVASHIREAIQQRPNSRLVLDGVHQLARLLSDWDRAPSFFSALFAWVRAHAATTLLTCNDEWLSVRLISHTTELAPLVDNIVELQQHRTGSSAYTLNVVKTRQSGHSETYQPYRLRADGITFEQVGDLITNG